MVEVSCLDQGQEITLSRLTENQEDRFHCGINNRIDSGEVIVVDEFTSIVEKLNHLLQGLLKRATQNCLIVSNNFTSETYLSARNVADSQLVTAMDVNTEEILNYDKIIITEGAMPTLSKRTNLN